MKTFVLRDCFLLQSAGTEGRKKERKKGHPSRFPRREGCRGGGQSGKSGTAREPTGLKLSLSEIAASLSRIICPVPSEGRNGDHEETSRCSLTSSPTNQSPSTHRLWPWAGAHDKPRSRTSQFQALGVLESNTFHVPCAPRYKGLSLDQLRILNCSPPPPPFTILDPPTVPILRGIS